jgi:hypothetical protein
MSLLTICQDAAAACGFSRPSSIVNNTDTTALQLLALANQQGEQMSKAKNWSVLVEEHTFTLATSDQDYALPSDFRWIVPNTTWDRSDDRIVLNPITGEEWQFLKAWSSVAGLNRRARIRGGQLEFEQTITSSDDGKTIAFEYLSKFWADVAATGTPKVKFTIDTDISLIDEPLFTLGVIWRFRRAKGLPYESELAEYQAQLNLTKAGDGGARRINMGGHNYMGIGDPNVPETGYGS